MLPPFPPLLETNFCAVTEYSGHAYEIANKLVLDRFDSIVTVSGDGLLHEVINGLMHREDWQEAMKIPVGVIPGGKNLNFLSFPSPSSILYSTQPPHKQTGSGNALAAEMGNINPVSAAVAIIKGNWVPIIPLKLPHHSFADRSLYQAKQDHLICSKYPKQGKRMNTIL